MKRLLVFVFAAVLCVPAYSGILVYKLTCSFNPWLDFNDVSYDIATSVAARQTGGYLVLDINDFNAAEWKLDADPMVILYGGTAAGKWGTYLDVNDANGSVDFGIFNNGGKEYDLLLDLWWDSQMERVGAFKSTLFGKIGQVDIGWGAKDKAGVAGSLKGVVEERADANDFFEAFGSISATLDTKYTQTANKAADTNQDNIIADIILDLDNKGYSFDRLPPNVCTLTVNINGSGAVIPDYNDQLMKVGRIYSMTAKPPAGVNFVNWTGDIPGPNSSPTLTFQMACGMAFTAHFLDVTRPTVTVTSPSDGQWLSNAVFTATGKAKDNVGIAAVLYKLNDEPMWHIADGTTNWKTPKLILKQNTNTIDVCSVDTSGNFSTNSRISFFCQTAIDINSIDTNSAMPFSFLKIHTSAAIDPSKNFIVRFFDSSGYEVNIPPVAVSSGSVVVSVPPYLNFQTGAIQQADVNLQIMQTSSPDGVSDVVPFTIQNLPAPPSLDDGVVTKSFLFGNLAQVDSLLSSSVETPFNNTPDVNAAIYKFGADDFNDLLQKIILVVISPGSSFTLGNLAAKPVEVNITTLQNTDKLIIGFVRAQALNAASSGRCGAADANALADAMLGDDSDVLNAADANYNAAFTGCDVYDFNENYDFMAGARGVGIGLAQAAGNSTNTAALPAAALLYLTTEQTGAMMAAAGAKNQSDVNNAILLQSDVNRVNNVLSSPLTGLLSKMQDDNLRKLSLDAKSIYDALAAVPLQACELTVIKTSEDGNGTGIVTVKPLPNGFGGTYLKDTVVTLTAKPDAGSMFTGWSGDASGTEKSVQITMDGDKSVTAAFNKILQTWRITATYSGTYNATLAVDNFGKFLSTNSGWVFYDPNKGTFPLKIAGTMSSSSSSITLSVSGSGHGVTASGSGSGAFDGGVSFPNGTSASGTVTITETGGSGSFPGGTNWTAAKQ